MNRGCTTEKGWFPDGVHTKKKRINCILISLDPDLIPGSGRSSPHSSTLAWKIPWAEEAGGLQSVGSRRVGHD